jgi:hypothetical protein
MFIVTVIDPKGDDRQVAETSEDVAAILDRLNWKTTVRVIVTMKR